MLNKLLLEPRSAFSLIIEKKKKKKRKENTGFLHLFRLGLSLGFERVDPVLQGKVLQV